MKLDKRQAAKWFSLGLVAGALAMGCFGRFHRRHYRRSPDPQRMVQRFGKGLDLTSEQHQKLSDIIMNNHPKVQALHQESRDKHRALRDTVRSQIRGILDPKQQAAFDKRIAERALRRKRRGKS